MTRSIAACLLLLAGFGTSSFAQDAHQVAPIAKEQAAAQPESPAAEEKNQRDYLAERRALAAGSDYRPYSLAALERGLLDEHFKRANDTKFTIMEVNEPLKQLIAAYPLGIAPNLTVAGFLEYVANNVEGSAPDREMLGIAKDYRATAQGIIDSILSTGDGKSLDTAWEVINQNEEYSLLEHLELTPKSQALVFEKGRPYDVFTVQAKDGSERKVIFDVSLFFGKTGD
jgi:hypothetical protein